MKQKLYLMMAVLLAAITVSLAACGDDKDEPTSSDSEFVGYWKLTSFTINGETIYDNLWHIQLNSDGSGVVTEFNMNSDGSCTFLQNLDIEWVNSQNRLQLYGSVGANYTVEMLDDNNRMRLTNSGYVSEYARLSKSEYEKLIADMKK